MIINASDENNVDTVRNKVKNFASSVGFAGFKVVILDEFDYMTPNAQAILRNLMETFSKHCRFILTCNYVEKIIDPIQSRCQTFQIIPPTKKDVAVQISKILTEERIQFELKELVPIVDSSYPDIRKIINTCQLNSSKGILKIDSSSISDADVRVKIIDILKSKDDKRNRYVNLRQAVADSRIQDFTELYTHLYEKVNDYAVGNTSAVIMILAQGQYKDAMIVDKEICFMATLIEINDVI
jgi:replication factor C small subunit